MPKLNLDDAIWFVDHLEAMTIPLLKEFSEMNGTNDSAVLAGTNAMFINLKIQLAEKKGQFEVDELLKGMKN